MVMSVLRLSFFVLLAGLVLTCSPSGDDARLLTVAKESNGLHHVKDALTSPYVTAGDRVYMIGHQDGTFPDLGWHITGEMGGIWNHPIKLMDGFVAQVEGVGEPWRLDSARKFVNYPFGNLHSFEDKDLQLVAERFQFVPDGAQGLLVEWTFTNQSLQEMTITFSFTASIDLRPTWLGDRTNMVNAADTAYFNTELGAMVAKDQSNNWFTLFGSSRKAENPRVTEGEPLKASLSYQLKIPAGQSSTVLMAIAGSYQSEEDLQKTYHQLLKAPRQALASKKARLAEVAATARLQVPDTLVQSMFEWMKYNTDWLVRDVPEIGRGLSAGLPDYPWWFGCDNTYSQQGVLAIGQHALARSTIQLLHQLSLKTNGNGRMVHEASTNGAVFNPGNVNETPHFVSLLAHYYRWTGDKKLVEEMYPHVLMGMDWLKQQDADGNGYPNGAGMMEIHGLDTEMIDVVAYTQQALESAGYLAEVMNDGTRAAAYRQEATQLKERIRTDWWVEDESSFADFIGTAEETASLVADAMVRADTLQKPWSVQELRSKALQLKATPDKSKRGRVVYHNWVVNTPLELGIATEEQASKALATARKYTNPYGMYVTGIDRTEAADSIVLKSRKKTFSYVGAVMTLPTGVQAIAEARYGHADQALDYLHRLGRSFSYALPGSMYEVSPDFGMMTQAWNLYAVAVPIVHYFFGLQPDAPNQTMYLSPRLPSAWPTASLDNVIVGGNKLSVTIERHQGNVTYSVTQTEGGWRIVLSLPGVTAATVNGQRLEMSDSGQVLLTGVSNTVVVSTN